MIKQNKWKYNYKYSYSNDKPLSTSEVYILQCCK